MTYINLTDDLCDPGKMLDTLSPETVKRAGYIDATKPAKRPAKPYTDPMSGLPEFLGTAAALLFACETHLKHSDDGYARHLAGKCHAALDDLDALTKRLWGLS